MDTVNIGTMFMKGVISKILNVVLKKQLGCNVNTQLNEFNVTFKDKRAHLHVSIDADMTQDELKALLENFGLGQNV